MKAAFTILCLSGLLGACTTPYQNSGFTGGFEETTLGDNLFQVTFKGNGYTSAGRVRDFALLRSAEVALEHGCRYFILVDDDDQTTTGTISMPTTTYATSYGNSTTFNTYGGTSSYSKASSTNIIACFAEKPEGVAFDARQVVASLRKKYRLKGDDL